MKKKIAKLLALGMSIALVFSLAACADNADPEPETTTEAVTTTEPQAEPATGESESVSESESESGEQPSSEAPEAQGITNPGSDVNAAVALYNDAVAKSGFTTANVQLKWGGSDTTAGELNKLSGGKVQPEFEQPYSKSATPGSINAGDVSSVSSADNGDSITMTIKLNNHTDVKGSGAKYGDLSYPYFITYADANELVSRCGNAAGLSGIELVEDSATCDLSNGVITATVDKASGKMTALSVSLDETVKGKAKVAILKVTAEIWGSGVITFS